MEKLVLARYQENAIIRFGIILFWTLFWLLNVIDKLIPGESFLWAGQDRVTQLSSYFASIGLESPVVTQVTLIAISILEFTAFFFMISALFYFIFSKREKAHSFLFLGILVSLLIFGFFTIGDQIFGDSAQLLEHSIYWIILVISWFIYIHFEK